MWLLECQGSKRCLSKRTSVLPVHNARNAVSPPLHIHTSGRDKLKVLWQQGNSSARYMAQAFSISNVAPRVKVDQFNNANTTPASCHLILFSGYRFVYSLPINKIAPKIFTMSFCITHCLEQGKTNTVWLCFTSALQLTIFIKFSQFCQIYRNYCFGFDPKFLMED